MFSGIVEWLGTVAGVEDAPPGIRLCVTAGGIADDVRIGDSVAVNGCCLTVVRCEGDRLYFEAGAETLGRTNLGRLIPGSRINLERSLRLSDRLGGHLVSGHVDGLGELERRTDEGDWSTCWFRLPAPLAPHLASKGSIAIDGVSLTLVDVTDDRFSVALIPHTLAVTTLGTLQIGDAVNIETDLLAKYVAAQLRHRESNRLQS